MGIRIDSVVVADNLMTIEEQIIDKKVGYCSDIDAINTALKKTLGI